MNKLAIVNGHPASEMLAPFDNPEYDIWVLGNRIDRYPIEHVDLIFEIHDDLSEHGDVEAYCNKLESYNKPMIIGENYPGYRTAEEVFDFEASKAFFGSEYLTSSTVYMLSEAGRRGYDHIEIYGAHMSVDDFEYYWQRPCLEAWIGFLRGKGLTVILPDNCPVGRSDYVEGRGAGGKPQFGVAPFYSEDFQSIIDTHKQAIERKQDERYMTHAEIRYIDGALSAIGESEEAIRLTEMQNQLKAKFEALAGEIQTHNGCVQAYERMMKVARALECGETVKSIKDEVVIK